MITIALALLIINILFIIAYAYAVTGMEFWPKQHSELQPPEKLEKEVKMRKKRSLVEDMMQCNLAMGMSRKELRRNMVNLTAVATKAEVFLTALQSIIPANFSQDMKNPCWYSNLTLGTSLRRALLLDLHEAKKFSTGLFQLRGGSRELYCLPYFFIAGFPKSGTTTLHEALQQHPQIAPPSTKEPQWWTRVPLEDMNTEYLKLTVMKYLLYFTEASKRISQNPKEGTITYDGSQSTLWDSNFYLESEDYCATPVIISRILPNAKFIILMRNPVTREYSDFFYSCFYTCGPDLKSWPKSVVEDPDGEFLKEFETNTAIFSNCLRTTNNSMHECIRRMRPIVNACGRSRRFPIGFYYIHLHKWLQFYPKENFLFLRTEDMSRQPSKMINRIIDFLGVDPVSKDQAWEWLRQKANAQTVYTTDSEKFRMKPETKQLLEEFYRPFNEKLLELIGNSEPFLWTTKQ